MRRGGHHFCRSPAFGPRKCIRHPCGRVVGRQDKRGQTGGVDMTPPAGSEERVTGDKRTELPGYSSVRSRTTTLAAHSHFRVCVCLWRCGVQKGLETGTEATAGCPSSPTWGKVQLACPTCSLLPQLPEAELCLAFTRFTISNNQTLLPHMATWTTRVRGRPMGCISLCEMR